MIAVSAAFLPFASSRSDYTDSIALLSCGSAWLRISVSALLPFPSAFRRKNRVQRQNSGSRKRTEDDERRSGAHGLARAMPGGLGAVAAGCHVAPAPASILGAVEEDAAAARVAAAAHAAELSGDQRVGCIVHDRHHQRGEGVAAGDEIARVQPVARQLQAAGASASAQDTVDLRHRLAPGITAEGAVFRQGTKCASYPPRVEQRGGCAGWLLFGAAHDRAAPVVIDHPDRRKPFQHHAEITQCIPADAKLDVIGVDEIEPQAIADEHERTTIGWCDEEKSHGKPSREGGCSDVTPGLNRRKQMQAWSGYLASVSSSLLLPDVQRVVVGSRNPVKIAAVVAVILRCTPTAVVHGVAVPSGVPDQPWGDDETRDGALTRAREALATDADADLAVGLEGGVVREANGDVRSCAWAAVVDRHGLVSVGGSLAMPLPPAVVRLLVAGVELGHAMDRVARTTNVKHGRGAVGLLTGALVSRQDAYEHLVTYALSRWIGRELWEADSVTD